MIEVNDELVEYVAELSKLYLSEEEKESFKGEFQKIINYINTLDNLDTEGVEPLSHTFPIVNVLREDIVKESAITKEELLANAPFVKDGCFKVPKTVE
jgi:aspartyl-tRNA(Asn)/glutamyl-tRNA(Gln) amidotransferase subunit C